MANDSIRGRQVVLRLTNKSGGALVEGDVVIISSGTAAAITTTTSAGQTGDMVGVCLESIAGDAAGRVCVMGYVPKINLSGAASLGDTLATHSVAKQAAPNASRGAGTFGEVLGTGTTPAALLWGFPDVSAAAGMAGDSLWNAAGDLAIGTGANTGGRLAIGTANQILRVNAGATAPEWVSAGRVLIAESTPTGTGTVTFSSIPAGYWKLEYEGVIKTTDTAAADYTSLFCYLNNDTTVANYRKDRIALYQNSSSQILNEDNAAVGFVANDSSSAGIGSSVFGQIIGYAETNFWKQIVWSSGVRTETGDGLLIERGTTEWESTVAVNRLDLVLGAGNFKAGTKIRLYGVY